MFDCGTVSPNKFLNHVYIPHQLAESVGGQLGGIVHASSQPPCSELMGRLVPPLVFYRAPGFHLSNDGHLYTWQATDGHIRVTIEPACPQAVADTSSVIAAGKLFSGLPQQRTCVHILGLCQRTCYQHCNITVCNYWVCQHPHPLVRRRHNVVSLCAGVMLWNAYSECGE